MLAFAAHGEDLTHQQLGNGTNIQLPDGLMNDSSVLVETEGLAEADGCWLAYEVRGKGRPISACPEGLERSGLLCYPPCPEGYKGIGPVCWKGLKPKGRGVGKVLRCKNGTELSMGFCFPQCPPHFDRDGPLCHEPCPLTKPFKCGMVCTADSRECTEEMIQVTLGGLGLAGGLATFVTSIIGVVGVTTTAIETAVGMFGIFGGSSAAAMSILRLLEQLTTYPMCYQHKNVTKAEQVLVDFRARYHRMFTESCKQTTNGTFEQSSFNETSSSSEHEDSVSFNEQKADTISDMEAGGINPDPHMGHSH